MLLVDVVGGVAQVLERCGEQLVRAVEHRDATFHFLEILGLEDHRPGVGGQAQLLHLHVVVADDRRRHRVRHGILVTGVERRVEVVRVDVLQVRELGFVDGLELLALDQRFHRIRRWHQHVVTLGASGKLGEELLVV